jgi:hypothetical protein
LGTSVQVIDFAGGKQNIVIVGVMSVFGMF